MNSQVYNICEVNMKKNVVLGCLLGSNVTLRVITYDI